MSRDPRRFWWELRAPAGADPLLSGGKAAGLARLLALDVPMPETVCVGEAAFASFVEANGLGERIERLANRLPDEDSRRELEQVVLEHALPARLAHDLAYAGRVAAPEGGTFAVRSSAVGEDSSKDSFAGRHATVLGASAEEVGAALRRCWASRWSRRAIDYRCRRGLPLHPVELPVVLQRLLPAQRSAVVFTRDPMRADGDRVLVNATWGLGEPLASGAVTPDSASFDRDGEEIEYHQGAKETALLLNGDVLVERPPADRGRALSPALARELVELCLTIERGLGEPVDVEAAHAEGRWQVLQARPITTQVDAATPEAVG